MTPALQLSVSTGRRRSFDTAFFGGLAASVRCNRACTIVAEALLDSRTARRLGSRRRLSRVRMTLPSAGRRGVVLKFSRSTRTKVRGLSRLTLTLRVVATAPGQPRRVVSRRIAISR